MKPGIIAIAVAAIGLTVFAAHDAQGAPKGLDLTLFGGNFISSDINGVPTPLDGRAFTAVQSGLAKGPGKPLFFSQAVASAVTPETIPADCVAQGLIGAPLSVTLVFTYNDGSLLSITSGDDSFYCTNGTLFSVVFRGTVTGGEGRYAGATGTWSGSAESIAARVVADVSIDLD